MPRPVQWASHRFQHLPARQFSKPLACDRTRSGLHLTTLQDAARWFKMVPTSQVKNGLHCLHCMFHGWPRLALNWPGKWHRCQDLCDVQRLETATPKSMGHQCRMFVRTDARNTKKNNSIQQLPFKKGFCSYLRHWSGDVCISAIDGNVLLAALATCSQLIHHLWWFGCRCRCRRKDLHTLQASCGQKV